MISKFPPIQGGESTKSYWLAKGLSERGHDINIVTNNMSVEPAYRQQLTVEDFDQLQSDKLKIYSSNPLDSPGFIPSFDPYTDKLVSRGLDASKGADLIFGWYLLPYAVAAGHVSRMTGIPYVTQHAGSDMKRLLPNPNLKSVLEKTLLDADGVMYYPGHKEDFTRVGVKDEDLFEHKVGYPDAYSKNKKKVKLNNYFLFMGKLTVGKGAEHAAAAIDMIKDKNYKLLFLGNGHLVPQLEKFDNVVFLNYVAPWRVPQIIANAEATIVAENKDFDVPKHHSRIPIESILAGTPVILSDYVKARGVYSTLDDLLVFRQKDESDLAEKMEYVVQNKKQVKESAINIRSQLAKTLIPFEEYIANVERFFEKIAGKK